MGKKSSSSAPAMDPRVGMAMEKQADIMEQQQNWYENEIYPWMQQQANIQNQNAEEDRKLAQQNYQYWQDFAQKQYDKQSAISDYFMDRYKNNIVPIEDSLIADARRYNTSAEAERQAQLAIGDYATSFAAQNQANNMRMQSYGINPTSGAYQAQNRASMINQAAVQAAAANQARAAAEALGWQKKAAVSSLGQQYVGNANTATQLGYSGTQLGSSNANSYFGQSSNLGQVGLNNINTLASSGLQNYGSLMQGWGQIGNLAMDASNYNMQAWATQQQAQASSSAGIGSMIGAGVTTAAIAI